MFLSGYLIAGVGRQKGFIGSPEQICIILVHLIWGFIRSEGLVWASNKTYRVFSQKQFAGCGSLLPVCVLNFRTEQNRAVQLGGTCKDHQVQLPKYFRANQKLEYINEGIVQMPLERYGRISHLSRKPVSVFHHPCGKEIFPCVQTDPPLAQLCAVPVHPVIGYEVEEIIFTSVKASDKIPSWIHWERIRPCCREGISHCMVALCDGL